jgi:hypothetical protein
MMAVVAVLAVVMAVVMAVLRATLFLYDLLGSDFLYSVAVNATLFVYIPILVIVELVFFAFYFPLRRKRRARVQTADRIMAPGRRESGEAERA